MIVPMHVNDLPLGRTSGDACGNKQLFEQECLTISKTFHRHDADPGFDPPTLALCEYSATAPCYAVSAHQDIAVRTI